MFPFITVAQVAEQYMYFPPIFSYFFINVKVWHYQDCKCNKGSACYSLKSKICVHKVASMFSVLWSCVPGYICFLIFTNCKEPSLFRFNSSLPQLILTQRINDSVFIVRPCTLDCEKDSREIAKKKLERECKQKSVKNT